MTTRVGDISFSLDGTAQVHSGPSSLTHSFLSASARHTRAALRSVLEREGRKLFQHVERRFVAFDVLELESRTPGYRGVQHATPPSLVCSGKTIFTPELLITLTPRVARRNLELPWWARLITFAIRRARLHTPRSFAPHVHTPMLQFFSFYTEPSGL